MQITALFHGRLSRSRTRTTHIVGRNLPEQPAQRGPPSTLWSAIPESESLNKPESRDGSANEETANEESMEGQTSYA